MTRTDLEIVCSNNFVNLINCLLRRGDTLLKPLGPGKIGHIKLEVIISIFDGDKVKVSPMYTRSLWPEIQRKQNYQAVLSVLLDRLKYKLTLHVDTFIT